MPAKLWEVIEMKIAVVAAAGKAGRKIVAEAAARGFEVTAFVRRAVGRG